MAQHAFFYDASRCSGCKTCVAACLDKHDSSTEFAFRKVYECGGGSTGYSEDGKSFRSTAFGYYVSIACCHCTLPKCVEVCPTTAMSKDFETGLVRVDVRKCIGCGYCHLSCPYGAPKVNESLGHSVKCDGCAELLAMGEKPVCVAACPARALAFGTVGDVSGWGEQADFAPLPPAGITLPNLYVKPCADMRPAGSPEVQILNVAEVL